MSEIEPATVFNSPRATSLVYNQHYDELCCASKSAQVDLDHNAWAAESSTWLTPPGGPRCDSAQAIGNGVVESSTSSTSSGSLDTLPTESTKKDEEDFAEFQSSSSDPFAQPIFVVNEGHETDACLPKQESDQHGLFEGLGLVEPVHARFDVTSRELRRTGKLWLRRLRLRREQVGLNNVTVLSGGRLAEQRGGAGDLNDKASNGRASSPEEDKEESAPCSPDQHRILRPVSSAYPRISDAHQDTANEVEYLVES